MNTIQVAVGVIFDSNQRVLLTKRPHQVSHGGYWEFPGGKIKDQESPVEALKREILEEVGLVILTQHQANQIEFDYPDKHVKLFVFYVTQFKGEAKRLTGQLDLRWVNTQDLVTYSFPEANQTIIEALMNYNRAE